MMDIVDSITRSRMMAGIQGKNTKPELLLRSALHRLGLRYRLHAAGLPGRPDIVLQKYRAAIQVHGCFWHRHEHCAFSTKPASNSAFWRLKFSETIRRDRRNLEALRQAGWRVAIVWECSINGAGAEVVARRILAWLRSRRSFIEIPKIASTKVQPAVRKQRIKPSRPTANSVRSITSRPRTSRG
jgi:DNA mismatch endonuclease (patch repair protein)